jgi:hypothetical protein
VDLDWYPLARYQVGMTKNIRVLDKSGKLVRMNGVRLPGSCHDAQSMLICGRKLNMARLGTGRVQQEGRTRIGESDQVD